MFDANTNMDNMDNMNNMDYMNNMDNMNNMDYMNNTEPSTNGALWVPMGPYGDEISKGSKLTKNDVSEGVTSRIL